MALVAVCALPSLGQAQQRQITHVQLRNAPVARLPYTAEYKTTHVKTLADGSTITQESSEVVAVDSQGRRMTATTTTPLNGDQTPKTRVMVFDPGTHTSSSCTVPGRQATVTAMPAPGAPRTPCSTSTISAARIPQEIKMQAERLRPTMEDLGTDTILGIEARGRRTTYTTPAGAIGNNEPLMRTSDVWTAVTPGLRGLSVRDVNNDPQMGTTTRELVNFAQAEPDAAVFQPPSGYEIVNREAGGCHSSSSMVIEDVPMPPSDVTSAPADAPAEPQQ
jgi:hypothetical protein